MWCAGSTDTGKASDISKGDRERQVGMMGMLPRRAMAGVGVSVALVMLTAGCGGSSSDSASACEQERLDTPLPLRALVTCDEPADSADTSDAEDVAQEIVPTEEFTNDDTSEQTAPVEIVDQGDAVAVDTDIVWNFDGIPWDRSDDRTPGYSWPSSETLGPFATTDGGFPDGFSYGAAAAAIAAARIGTLISSVPIDARDQFVDRYAGNDDVENYMRMLWREADKVTNGTVYPREWISQDKLWELWTPDQPAVGRLAGLRSRMQTADTAVVKSYDVISDVDGYREMTLTMRYADQQWRIERVGRKVRMTDDINGPGVVLRNPQDFSSLT